MEHWDFQMFELTTCKNLHLHIPDCFYTHKYTNIIDQFN